MEFDLSTKVSCKHRAAFLKCPDHLTSIDFASQIFFYLRSFCLSSYFSVLCVGTEFQLRSLVEKKSLLHFRKVCIETINILKVLLCLFVTLRCWNSVMGS